MGNTTPTTLGAAATAAELRAAADVLGQVLPGRFNYPARLATSTSERLDAVAFCARADVHPADERCCEVVDLYDPPLAAVVVALLNSRHAQAASLRGYAEIAETFAAPVQGPVAEVVHAVFGAGEVRADATS
jgi:hypothetical protein